MVRGLRVKTVGNGEGGWMKVVAYGQWVCCAGRGVTVMDWSYKYGPGRPSRLMGVS